MRPVFREGGAVLVESALTLMVFLMMILGIMEAGRLLEVRNVVTEAAREGARFAVAPEPGTSTLPTQGQIVAYVQAVLASASIDTTTAVIPPPVQDFPFPGDPKTTCTQVIVSVPYQVLTPLVPLGGITITAQSVMRNETSH